MTPTAWRRVGELFHEAVALPLDRRAAWAAEACSGDPELLRQLENLLESDAKARAGLLKDRVKAGLAVFVEEDARARTPRRAGPYRLVREIGRGGMGTVYLGERDDQQYTMDVAVKLVTPGMDTDFVLQRFRRERQILAGFDHPNIARLLDGGATAEGLPYIVMEYVDGLRITEYCRTRESTIDQRLTLFLDVCAAVEHAHRHFVVHRDLKPGNILVNTAGVPKLLDFGICKLLYSDPLLNEDTVGAGSRLMTPEYASPEQIRGEAVTVASDVYSLGAVLYELLTGAKPHRFANFTMIEIERVVCEGVIVRPSLAAADHATSRRLSGDLDTILMRALDKVPDRRYLTAQEFAADVRRYLTHVPVKARADTLAYRARKFLQRRRGIVIATVAVQAALIGGALVALNQARIANARLQNVRQLANSVVFDIHDAVRSLPGSIKARQLIVETGLRYLDSTAATARNDVALQVELARAYLRIGEIQGDIMNSNLGNIEASMASYEKARALLDAVLAKDSRNLPARVERVSLGLAEGHVYYAERDRNKALAVFQEAARIGEPLIRDHPGDRILRRTLAEVHNATGLVYRGTQELDACARETNAAAELLRQTPAADRDDELQYLLAGTLSNLGNVEAMSRHFDGGLAHLHEAVAQLDQLERTHPENAPYQHQSMLAWAHIADAFSDKGDEASGIEAVTAAEHFVAIARKLHLADPADQRAAADHGIALTKLVELLPDSSVGARLAALRESVPLLEEMSMKNAKNAETRIFLSFAQMQLGNALAARHDSAGATAAWNRAISIAEPLLSTGQRSPTVTYILACRYLGEAAAARGDRAAAEEFASKAWVAGNPAGALAKSRSPEVQKLVTPATFAARGFVYEKLGDRGRAVEAFTDGAAAWREAASVSSAGAVLRREMQQAAAQLAALEGRRK